MNKHKKLALFIAPFLMLLGYIASDYYLENDAEDLKLYQLQADGPCRILVGQCQLSSSEFKVNLSDKNGTTELNATYPLDRALLLLVNSEGKFIEYPLGMQKTPYYWSSKTPIRQILNEGKDLVSIKLIASIKGGRYIAEFEARSN